MGGGQSQERVVNVEGTTGEDGAPKIIVRDGKKCACTNSLHLAIDSWSDRHSKILIVLLCVDYTTFFDCMLGFDWRLFYVRLRRISLSTFMTSKRRARVELGGGARSHMTQRGHHVTKRIGSAPVMLKKPHLITSTMKMRYILYLWSC